MENNEDKQIEQKQEQKQQSVSSAPVQGKKSNTALIVILCVVGVLVLGVGGWYGYKYYQNKSSQSSTSTTDTTSTTGKTNVSTILTKLMYPNATVTEQREEENSVYKAELYLATTDSVDTIKAYYQKLVTDNNWKITTQGSVDTNNYYATIKGDNFTADVECTKYEGYDTTDLSIKISGDNLISDGVTVTSTSSSSSSTSASGTTSSSDYVISDSSTRVISESELTDLSPWQLKVARNEIYARHGREFVHKDLQCYFAKKNWYLIDSNFSESMLSTTENKNVATIKAYEEKISSPLANKDSGCDTNQ